MKKCKIIALIALILIAALAFSSCASKNTGNASGKCANSEIEWEYVSSDKTLKLSGKGDIPSFSSSSDTPWKNALPYLEKIEMTEGITAIGDKAFYGASKLKSVNIPSSVTAIGERAFAYSASLEEISLPAALKTVGAGAFEGCSSLENATLGENLETLGERAFAFCASLKNVSILGNVEIKSETFYNCSSLEKLIRNKDITNDKVAENAFKNTDFDYSKTEAPIDPNAKITVTIEYVYEDGTEAAASKVISELSVGTSYSQTSPEIEGFVADRETVSGIASDKDVTEKVIYKAVVVETEAVSENETAEPTVDEEEKNNGIGGYIALVVMIVVIAAICVGALKLKKAEQKREEKERNQNKAKNRKQ